MPDAIQIGSIFNFQTSEGSTIAHFERGWNSVMVHTKFPRELTVKEPEISFGLLGLNGAFNTIQVILHLQGTTVL